MNRSENALKEFITNRTVHAENAERIMDELFESNQFRTMIIGFAISCPELLAISPQHIFALSSTLIEVGRIIEALI